MKRLFIIAVALVSLGSFNKTEAQCSNFSQTASNPTGAISNAGIDTMTLTASKNYQRALISLTYTRTANTAAGTAILEYRASTAHNWTSDAGDTLTITNAASKTYVWNKTVPAPLWRVRVGGATTVTATVAARFCGSN